MTKTTVASVLVSLRWIYIVMGGIFASWPARLPEIKQSLGMDDQLIGHTILGVSLGSGVGLISITSLLRLCGASRIAAIGSIFLCSAYIGVAFAHNAYVLAGAFFLIGLSFQCTDVAVNIIASTYEQTSGTHVLSQLHGTYSVGTFCGAFIGSLCATYHIPYSEQCLGIALSGMIIMVCTVGRLRSVPFSESESQSTVPSLGSGIVILAIIAIAALFVEGVTNDWSTLFLHEAKNIPTSYAGYGITLCAFMMSVGRLGGDKVRARYGNITVLVVASWIVLVGVCGFTFLPSYYSLVSLFFLGIGLSVIFPLIISIAGQFFPQAHERAVTILSSVTFVALLAAPPTMGTLAHQYTMAHAMWLVPFLWLIALAALPYIARLAHAKQASVSHTCTHASEQNEYNVDE